MKNLAQDIFRQRLLIEGFFDIDVDKKVIADFFIYLLKGLSLKAYGEPIIYSPEGLGKEQNQGYDCFIPLIDSGISLYIWTNKKFLSLVIYTCKGFDDMEAIRLTKDFWKIKHAEFKSF
jgi:hypothetical protein